MKPDLALSFFRDVELMSIPDAPWKVDKKFGWVREFSRGSIDPAPWRDTDLLDTDRVQYFLIHLGCARKTDMIDHVVKSIDPKALRDPYLEDQFAGSSSALGTVVVDWRGRILPASFQPATFVLGTKRLRQKASLAPVLHASDALAGLIAEEIAPETCNAFAEEPAFAERLALLEEAAAQAQEGGNLDEHDRLISLMHKISIIELPVSRRSATIEDLVDLADRLVELLGFPAETIIRVQEAGRQWRSESPPPKPPGKALSSFLFSELSRLCGELSETDPSPALDAFLRGRIEPEHRRPVMGSADDLKRILDVEGLPPGRWPAPPRASLSLGQQIGVHEALSDSPLTAVNGPPGTGKTTLLRDIIANRVVERAERLMDLDDPSDAFTEISIGGRSVPVANEGLVARTGIVVTSNSNAAVENVSKELPQAQNIDQDTFPEATYLAAVAEQVAAAFGDDLPSWGFISAPMGKRANTKKVIFSLCGRDDKGKQVSSDISALLRQNEAPAGAWGDARRLHATLLADFKKALRGRGTRSDITRLNDVLAARSDADRHKMSVWTDPGLETLRARIFLSALHLHELVLAENAKDVGRAMETFADMLEGEIEIDGDEHRVALWNTLFLIVPVISTTFVSVQSLPSTPQWIGDLLVDEAGQATPQSVLPGLQRACRATIVGDPLQLEPIINVPRPVIEALRQVREIPPYLSPTTQSVQTIADGTMPLGAIVPPTLPGRSPTWTGLPLRVHRRCAEPMFRLSNQVAYGGQMVHGGDPIGAMRAYDSLLGRSAWFDVRGRPAWRGSRAIKEEIDLLRDRLAHLRDRGYFTKADAKVIVISPFANVQGQARKCVADTLPPDRRGCVDVGTIHRFQGREADIVFLVLGSSPGPRGRRSREWAGLTPNMLNVAVSRARKRLFVIGNHADWKSIQNFSVMASLFARHDRVIRIEQDVQGGLLPRT